MCQQKGDKDIVGVNFPGVGANKNFPTAALDSSEFYWWKTVYEFRAAVVLKRRGEKNGVENKILLFMACSFD